MSNVQGPLTCWKRVHALLLDLLHEVHPQDSTEVAFFYLKISELVDVACSKCKEDA